MANWYHPSDPSSIKPIPWLGSSAIAYLESLLYPDMIVAEFGGGGSTLWFAERVKQVVTYENDPDWERAIKANAPANVIMAHTMNTICDLLLIDGEPVEERAQWLRAAPRMVRAGGYIVLDNANRPEIVQARDEFLPFAELLYTSPLEGKHLVTEFYKLKG